MKQRAIRIPEIQDKQMGFEEVFKKLSMSGLKKNINKIITNKFNPKNNASLFHGDCLKFLKSIPDNSVNLIVTSPPYNIGKEYEKKSKINEYYDWQREVIRECHRILKDDGSICWQVGNYVDNGEVIPLDLLLYPIFTELKNENAE